MSMDRVTVVSSLFDSVSRGQRDRDQNVVQSFRDRQNLHKILERKAEFAVVVLAKFIAPDIRCLDKNTLRNAGNDLKTQWRQTHPQRLDSRLHV